MKYGILYRKTTKNIGDDIQSYAQSQWLPSVDYLVDIENLDGFKSENDEPVAVIMSSWYMWHKWNWPPSKDIYPLWVGFHYSDKKRGRPRGMPSKWEYLKGPGYDYLKNYEPIGCRDYYTQKQLEDRGLKTFFSGCITLTLKKREIVKPEREYVVLVGLAKRVENAVIKQLEGTGIDIKIIAPTRDDHATNIPWEERQAEVESMLDTYQNAKCVITYRLHCALPTLALGTPVLLVRKTYKSVRFNPYANWLHHAYDDEVVEGKYKDWILNPPPNPDDYLETRRALEKTVSEFISQAQSETKTATELNRLKTSPEELMQWQNKTMKQTLAAYQVEARYDLNDIFALQKEVELRDKQIAKQEKTIENLKHKNEVYHSAISYRFALVLYKIKGKLKKLLHK